MARRMVLLVGLVCLGLGLAHAEISSGQQSETVRLAWPDGSYVLVSSDRAMELVLREHVGEAVSPLPKGFIRVGPVREILGVKLPVEVSLSYPEKMIEQVGSVNRLRMFRLDEGRGVWDPLDGMVRTEDRCVVARSDRVGMFALGLAKPAFADDFSDMRIYPNPFKPNDGNPDTGSCIGGVTWVTIDRLPPRLKSIEIYDASGTLVATSGRAIVYDVTRDLATWQCVNDDGDAVVSGMYILAMENQNGKQRTAKIGVIK